MTDILGYDVNGRPLRAGDKVRILKARTYQTVVGQICRVTGPSRKDPCAVITDMPFPDPAWLWCRVPCQHLERLDDRTDHQPSEYTFDALLDTLKTGAPDNANA